jgi:predicted MPP superfamily phosphohydrolase
VDSTIEAPSIVSESQPQQLHRSAGRIAVFVGVVQSVLLLAHWFVYETWASFQTSAGVAEIHAVQVAFAVFSVSFMTASLLTHWYSNFMVSVFYKAAALWMGLFNFLFLAACTFWVIDLPARLLGFHSFRTEIGEVVFAVALLAFIYAVINARWIRVKRISVKLPNLPAAWRGRVAALVSDIHLGPVNGASFMRRIVGKLSDLSPDVVFIAGDLYDGTKVEPRELISSWKNLDVPHGVYFVTGNHEEFGDSRDYTDAVKGAGIRVLDNEKITLEGLQIVGVNDRDLVDADHLRVILESTDISRNRASILLAHTPSRLAVAEQAGISLQLSGHTHRGQIFPFTWFTYRIFGSYTYGLSRLGELITYTSSGVGTWGPPLRLGTQSEIVLIELA